MAKIRITMKDPDTLDDAIRESVAEEVELLNLPADEAEVLIETRKAKASRTCERWFQYGEYLTVEINTDDGTCTVCENQ